MTWRWRRGASWLSLTASVLLLASCTTGETVAPTTSISTTTPPANDPGPAVAGVGPGSEAVGIYEKFELVVDLEADFENPFDQREVSLDASFAGPDGSSYAVPGFWDARDSWRVRFAPPAVGEWEYRVSVTDHRGTSRPLSGSFEVVEGDGRGWLQIGSDIDPSYSPRYLAYSDGTPWYGRGHADLDMALGGPDANGGLRLFNSMPERGENFVMWWPTWGSNFIQADYSRYSAAQLEVIDFVLEEAEAADASLTFTVWTHQYLRTGNHPWGDARWRHNGFSLLTDIEGFFVDEESLAWQENYYRYIIARYAHSPAVAMWQTITEINGTESYDQINPWHEAVNRYFQENDPYRHPTTATMSGWVDWPEGHAAMDMPQVHLYHELRDPIEVGAQVAEWTGLMWDREAKPNWIGEYGLEGQQHYPELMHHANWAALAAGASITPTEWNDGGAFGRFDEEMAADMARLAAFVEAVPLVTYNPEKVAVTASEPGLRGWGVAGDGGGVIWVQDFTAEDGTMEEIRGNTTMWSGASLEIAGMPEGTWIVRAYDTWGGQWLAPGTVGCAEVCSILLPDFTSDIAIALERG
ncbi:MAG: DUF5060 domain-containing protein [Acidimicrobiia bacterium]